MDKQVISKRLDTIHEYYFSKKLRHIEQLRKEGLDIINLGIGNPDIPPPKEVETALIKGVQEIGYNAYQSYKGLAELRITFSAWYKKYFEASLHPETEILPLMGSKEGIMHISMAFINQGDTVLVPNPGYPTYAAASKLAGGAILTYNLTEENNFHPNFNALEKYDLSKVKLMWVNYPHMPTGAEADEGLYKNLLEFSRKHQIIIVNDNPYAFILTKTTSSLLKYRRKNDWVLELNSLSKSHNMAGWRVGMVGGNENLIHAILTFKSNMDSGQFKPVMRGAIEALKINDNWYKKINEIYAERREKVFEIAQLLNCSYRECQVGMFVWAKIPVGFENGEDFADYLLEKYQIFVPPGSVFGDAGRHNIRFSLCSDVQIWNEVLNRIKNKI